MKPARKTRSDKSAVKLLIVEVNKIEDSLIKYLPEHLQAGDVLVVNDAATIPASFHGRDVNKQQIEVRLAGHLDDRIWRGVIFGAGDWHTPTEQRPSSLNVKEGDEIIFAEEFKARVLRKNDLSARLLDLEFNYSDDELWRKIYQYGKPVQYSYMNDELALWSVQNIYSSRPWAVEMPSAGHSLSFDVLLKLLEKGIMMVPLTHAAGLSSTGDEAIDRALPFAERFEIPQATQAAINQAKESGGRIIAVGTSVVRALESWAIGLSGWTDLKIGPGHKLKVADGLLTGTHDVSESHYQLLSAFLPTSVLATVSNHLDEAGYLTHEFGDACLILNK